MDGRWRSRAAREHCQQEREQTASARSASPASAGGRSKAPNQQKERDKPEHEPTPQIPAAIPGVSNPPRWRLAAKRYARIVRDVLCYVPRGNLGGLAVVALAQVGHHRAAGISRARIIDHRLKPVAHFDAVFALVGSDKQQHSTILFLTADAQLFVALHPVILDAFSFERVDGHNCHLRASLLLNLRAQRLEPCSGFWADHTSQVTHITGGMNFLDVFRCAEHCAEQKQAVKHCGSKEVSFSHEGSEAAAK